MSTTKARAAEHDKYTRCYEQENYRMHGGRMKDTVDALSEIPFRGSYLDVSCGRGEMLGFADYFGFSPVMGTEVVPKLLDGDRVRFAEVHALPFTDKSFDVVSMHDVIEHLIPGDDELACRELARVARKHILVSASNRESKNKAGDVLHINIRPYEEWNSLFRDWFVPHKIIWIYNTTYHSQIWRIDIL